MARQANAIALTGVSSGDGEGEHACLTIKATTATKTGIRALARVGGDRADRTRSLAARIRRHSLEADAALEHAGAALVGNLPGGPQAAPQVSLGQLQPANAVRRFFGGSRATGAAAVILAALVVTVMIVPLRPPRGPDGNGLSREGTLAGNGSVAPSTIGSPEPSRGDGEVAAGASLPAEATLTVDFDAERIGEGLGTEWVQTSGGAGAVALAPFPTAVNRSARLESLDAVGAETCRPVRPATGRISRLFVDVLLSEATTTAVVIARNTFESAEVRVNLGALESSFTVDGASPLARGGGLPAGEWVRAEIISQNGQTLWRVGAGSSGAVMEQTIEVDALKAVDEMCLAVTTDSTGAAHFDNLTIAILQNG